MKSPFDRRPFLLISILSSMDIIGATVNLPAGILLPQGLGDPLQTAQASRASIFDAHP